MSSGSRDTEPTANVGSTPDERERRQRLALAESIERRKDEVERRWLDEVQRHVVGGDRAVEPTQLRNAIGEYLRRLAASIRAEGCMETGGSAAWADIAREHALTRVRLGFDIDQLVREFVLLRRVLFDVAREEGLVSSERHGERLADLIEAAIAVSVRSYIESRDVSERRLQAEYVGFVTHELRNPLSTAMMAAARLRRNRDVVEAENDTMDLLDRGLNRLRALIDGILLTQRADAREMHSQSVEMRLGDVMVDATRSAELESRSKGLTLTMRYDPGVRVHVDPALTTSALQNVVDNAVKFTDHGEVRIEAEERPAEVVIHVFDNCESGLSTEEMKTIFEPFKRARSGKTGTGLGLAIASRAIEAQGGRIGVESRDERGCHFWLTLPKAK